MAGATGRLPGGGDILRELPGYRIERQLGRGSMGVVYLAEDVQLRRKVALKVLLPALADDELFRKRFDRESQSAANLDHPHIVPVYAAGEAGGALYIAMRYVSGGDLLALLDANGPLSLEQAASVITPVADALDTAHAQGMVHRDVKPANILIDGGNGKEHYYLSDFGITKIVSSGTSLTSVGQVVGTIDYIAPEQIQGKLVDGRADLYALGCVLYQCLTGVVPFLREETAAFMWAHVHDEAPPVTTRRPDLPPQINRVVARAMAKQPEDRYATCGELALALRAVASVPEASHESIGPAGLFDSPPPPVAPGMTSTYTPRTAPVPARASAAGTSSRRRWPWWWWVLGGVLTLALIAGSTVAVLKYVSVQFPDEAERTLLGQLPLALTLKNSCTRDVDGEQDTVNVRASVICTPDGDANRVVFTTFTSTQILGDRYNAAVATSGVGPNSGDCRIAERAEGTYQSGSGRTSGRVLCYQERGSSFIEWTDDGSRTLGLATRLDPDYAKLRAWWAGVVDRTLPVPESAHASNPAPTPPLAPAAPAGPPPPPTAVPLPAPGAGPAGSAGKADEGRRQPIQPTSAPATTPADPTTTSSRPMTSSPTATSSSQTASSSETSAPSSSESSPPPTSSTLDSPASSGPQQ